ncbi:MAG: hypothetical protein AB7U71_10870 [Comamonas sp.]|nr:hypothetical protein [Comamonas thiooxydans]UUE95011.1 hypothetical protein MJ608_04965 [Comamonas thiooxydans]
MSHHSHLRRNSRPASAGGCASLREIWVMRWLMGLLALAMVLGPTLGQMHRAVHAVNTVPAKSYVAHSHVQPTSSAVAAAGDCQSDNSGCAPDQGWVHALFAGHGPAECQLLDQASHGYAGPVAIKAFSAPAPDSFIPRPFAPEPRAIFIAAPLAARAPPQFLRSLA